MGKGKPRHDHSPKPGSDVESLREEVRRAHEMIQGLREAIREARSTEASIRELWTKSAKCYGEAVQETIEKTVSEVLEDATGEISENLRKVRDTIDEQVGIHFMSWIKMVNTTCGMEGIYNRSDIRVDMPGIGNLKVDDDLVRKMHTETLEAVRRNIILHIHEHGSDSDTGVDGVRRCEMEAPLDFVDGGGDGGVV